MPVTERSQYGVRNYYGLSTDPKSPDAPIGSTFFEADTSLEYEWTGYVWAVRSSAGLVSGGTSTGVTTTPVNTGVSITSDQEGVLAAIAGLRLYGYSVMEDAGGPASFRIVRGTTVLGGVQAELVSLVAGESTADYWGPDGVATDEGVSVDWLSGSFKLSFKSKVQVGLPAPLTVTPVSGGGSVVSDQDAVVPADPGLRLYGYSVLEDVGNPASFRIMEGLTAAGGVQVEPVSIVARESTADYWGPEGVLVPGGLSIDWVSGSFKLSLKTKVV